MADLMNPQGILSLLQAREKAYQDRISALQQPQPQQGGFLSGADPVMLALAQGLLSPTKTGSFGESIGNAAGAVQGPLSEIRKQEQSRLDKIQALEDARTNMLMKMYGIQTGADRRYKPDDPNLVYGRYLNNLESLQAQRDAAETPEEETYWQEQINEYKKSSPRASAKKKPETEDSSVEPTDEVKETKTPAPKSQYAQPKTKEEYDALPSGAVYIHPDTGKPKVKP